MFGNGGNTIRQHQVSLKQMNTEMALFYLHAIFKKKVSSTSGSCSKAGFKSYKLLLVLPWLPKHRKTSLDK